MANPSHGEAAHGVAEHVAPPLPQLEFSYWPSQIIWATVALIALYFVLTKMAIPRVAGTLAERQDTIANDLDQAAEFEQKAQEAEKAYDDALLTARREAQAIAEKTRAEIAKQTEAAMAEADAQIAVKAEESSKRIAEIEIEAKASAKEVALEAAKALVARFSPKPVDAAKLGAAVDTQLAGRFGG